MEIDQVKCTECGVMKSIPQGFLTQEGKRQYVCETCSEQVLENRVAEMEDRKGGRQLLID
jgi:DNA-directed RNA polymerase subunit RPC12/RpoP